VPLPDLPAQVEAKNACNSIRGVLMQATGLFLSFAAAVVAASSLAQEKT
jgi:hypothetical protein